MRRSKRCENLGPCLTRDGPNVSRPEHPFGEQIVGPDGVPPPLFAQPMLHWLANIISSQAFADYQTVEQALSARPPKNNGSFRTVPWAKGKENEPVFPKWTANGRGKKPRTPTSWATQAHGWAKRAGFVTQVFGMHAARRAALMNVDRGPPRNSKRRELSFANSIIRSVFTRRGVEVRLTE